MNPKIVFKSENDRVGTRCSVNSRTYVWCFFDCCLDLSYGYCQLGQKKDKGSGDDLKSCVEDVIKQNKEEIQRVMDEANRNIKIKSL